MIRKLLAVLVALSLQAVTGIAHAAPPYIHTVCVKLRTGHLDAATGDYGTGSLWLGRGIKISTSVSAPTYASQSTGCAVFAAPGPALGNVTVYAESRVGANDNLFVRSFPTRTALETWDGARVDANLPKWVVAAAGTACVGNVCTTTVTNTASTTETVSNAHAAATWSVYHIDLDSPDHLVGTQELLVHASGCSNDPQSSCMEDGRMVSLGTLNSAPRRKFLIGHEVGHWWHYQWGASLGGSYFVSDPEGTACDSTGIVGDHALRSLEYQRAAFTEGFAHYLSTLAYNDHASTGASFQYYKIYLPTGYDNDLVNVEAGPTGGSTNTWANTCGCPSCDVNVANVDGNDVSTELDWLRTFWDFRTDPSLATQPSHNDVFDLAAASVGQTTAYADLTAEVPAAFLARWNTATALNGVDH